MNGCKVWLAVCAVVGLLASTANAVNIETVSVGNPGNAGELSGRGAGAYGPDRVCGSVSYTYNIGKYEVTAGQYTECLNAVAKTDTYGLYNPYMGDVESWRGCNIQRSGQSGSFTYSVAPDWANRPVNYVSYWDACRFVNWLENNQPAGDQGPGTTETGTYTLNGYNGSDGGTIQRNPNARWVLPTEDEWYKAAYYDPNKPGGAGYWDYATRGDTMPSNTLSAIGRNNANYTDWNSEPFYTIGAPYWRTEVGAFAGSMSAYGTFEQSGNVTEWNETVISGGGRDVRGGGFTYFNPSDMSAAFRCYFDDGFVPNYDFYALGFRVAALPEPATLTLLVFGGLVLARRRRCR